MAATRHIFLLQIIKHDMCHCVCVSRKKLRWVVSVGNTRSGGRAGRAGGVRDGLIRVMLVLDWKGQNMTKQVTVNRGALTNTLTNRDLWIRPNAPFLCEGVLGNRQFMKF